MNNFKTIMRSRTLLFFVLAVLALAAQLFLLNKFIVVSHNYQYNVWLFKIYSLSLAVADAVVGRLLALATAPQGLDVAGARADVGLLYGTGALLSHLSRHHALVVFYLCAKCGFHPH